MTRTLSSPAVQTAELAKNPNTGRIHLSDVSGLLNVKQAAVYLNISRSHLYDLIKDGELARIKIGRRTLFATRDLDTFATEQRDSHRNQS